MRVGSDAEFELGVNVTDSAGPDRRGRVTTVPSAVVASTVEPAAQSYDQFNCQGEFDVWKREPVPPPPEPSDIVNNTAADGRGGACPVEIPSDLPQPTGVTNMAATTTRFRCRCLKR